MLVEWRAKIETLAKREHELPAIDLELKQKSEELNLLDQKASPAGGLELPVLTGFRCRYEKLDINAMLIFYLKDLNDATNAETHTPLYLLTLWGKLSSRLAQIYVSV